MKKKYRVRLTGRHILKNARIFKSSIRGVVPYNCKTTCREANITSAGKYNCHRQYNFAKQKYPPFRRSLRFHLIKAGDCRNFAAVACFFIRFLFFFTSPL